VADADLSVLPPFAVPPFPSLLFFPSPSLAKRSGESFHTAQRKKRQPAATVAGDQMHSVPVISEVGGEASHGSNRVVATI